MKIQFLIFYSLIIVACSNVLPPPHTIDQACSIIQDRPSWKQSLQQAHHTWQTPIELILTIIRHESSFRAQARPPMRYALGFIPLGRRSTAYGYAQVLDRTWQWYQEKTGHTHHVRDQFEHAVQFVAWYTHRTYQKYRVPFRRYDLHYLAYHEGHGGFRRKTYKHKNKLLKYAKKVAKTAKNFRQQLQYCP